MNFGKGAYKQGLYWDGISDDEHYGYGDGPTKQQVIEGWEIPEGIHDLGFDSEDTVINEELEDSDDFTLNGITEYGIGFWSRFLWNGMKSKLVNKPDWMGLTRISSNKVLNDQRFPGDRVLCILVGRGFY